jgi:hypothetical protein
VGAPSTGEVSSDAATVDAARSLGASRSGAWTIPLLVVVCTAGLAIWAIEPWPLGVFQDDGLYAILGKAIASGEGFRYLNLPDSPAATHYPPGYPLVLAMLWRLFPAFPANTAVFLFANVAFLCAAATGAWSFGQRRLGLSAGSSAAAALATVACVPALTFGVFVLSEPLFMALLFPVLLASERAADSGAPRDAALAGLLAGVLAMVRTMGIWVAPALVTVLVLRRRRAAAVVALAAMALTLVPWQIWVALHASDVPPVIVGKYGSYGGWLSSAISTEGPAFVVRVVWKNLGVLRANLWEMLGAPEALSRVAVMIATAAAVAVVAVLAVGTRHWVRRAPVTVCFVALYLAIVLIWPFEPTRFVWALLPLTGLAAAVTARSIINWRPNVMTGRTLRFATLGLMLIMATGYTVYNVRGFAHRSWTTGPRGFAARATPLVNWVRRATQPGDLLATDDDALVHLYSGRRTIPVGTFTPQEYLEGQSYDFATGQLELLLREFRPRYVLCGSAHCAMAARNLSLREPPLLRLVTPLERGVVFESVAASFAHAAYTRTP